MYAIGKILLCAMLALVLGSCDDGHERRTKKQQERWAKLSAEYEAAQKLLLAEHKGTLFPPEEFADRAVFTYTLQRFLVTETQQPVVMKCIVDDIIEDGDELQVHATAFFSKNPQHDGRRLLVQLRARKDVVDPLLQIYQEPAKTSCCCCGIRGPLVYVVAKVSEVSRVSDVGKREALGYQAVDDDLYEAVGELVALKRLPEG